MIHKGKDSEIIWLCSMGKKFRLRAITDSDDEANEFMRTNRDTATIACYGPFTFIANLYEGEPIK